MSDGLIASMAQALRDPAQPCPAGLRESCPADPAQRFAIYRNNVQSSLIDALADTFPVCRALVGADFFIGLARAHLQACPPRSPVLMEYGAEFADFIAGYPPAASLPYLADMARLERAYVMSAHAADSVPLTSRQLQDLLSRADLLHDARFQLDPALALVRSDYAVASLWGAHQEDDVTAALAGVRPGQPETALLVRSDLVVAITAVPQSSGELIQHLIDGASLGSAASIVQARHPDFDLASALGLLIAYQSIIHFQLPGAN